MRLCRSWVTRLMAVSLKTLPCRDLAFWSRGNRPTQRAFGIGPAQALLHLKALCLLAERVVAAASFFFESPVTRTVIAHSENLVTAGELLFFVNEEYETFSDHGLRKVEKSPEGLVAYRDRHLVLELGQRLDSLGDVLQRPNQDLSAVIVDLWNRDLLALEPGSLGDIGRRLSDETAKDTWYPLLLSVPQDRQGDFVWECVHPVLRQASCPPWAVAAIRRRLAQLYSESTAILLGANLDSPSFALRSSPLTDASEFDTTLFLACLRSLGCLEEFARYDVDQTMAAAWIRSHK